jgi:hypothetical protein
VNPSTLLLLTIVLGLEFGLKQFFETYLEKTRANPIRTYVVYRLIHLASMIILMSILVFTNRPFWYCLLPAVIVVLIGVSELLFCLVQEKLHQYTKMWHTWLYFIPGIGLITYVNSLDLELSLLLDAVLLTKICVFILLSYPVNYAIRWLINKEWSQTLPELVIFVIPTKPWALESAAATAATAEAAETAATAEAAETAATADNVYKQTTTLKAGRTIGILERWIWLLFILLGYPSLIGFVITAKSIARFKKLDDSDFAEYYLMGTLYSALFTFLMSLLIPGIWE